MKFLKFHFVIIFALMYHKVLLKEVKCPSHCVCDIFEEYRRANCQNRTLIGIEAEIPSEVQLLDLSYNLIYELYDNIFVELQLTELLLLNVSHNKISSIHIRAFAKMDYLKTLDLSYNKIEYVLTHWFWNTPVLEELYLRGNNLFKLKEPISESSSIKVLDLSACSLLYVHKRTFSEMPQLEILDLSENFLAQLHAEVFKPCPNLKKINIDNNSLNCNLLGDLIEYCISNEIIITNPCRKIKPNLHKLERMIAATEEPKRNSWIYEEYTTKAAPNVCICETTTQKGILLYILQGVPVLVLLTTFCAGLGLGLVIACSLNKTKKPRRRKIRRTRPVSDIYLALTDAFEVSETTPMAARRQIT